jgi:signal transduction histidine kinase
MISASRPSSTSSTLADVGLRARTLAVVGLAVALSVAEFIRSGTLALSSLADIAVGWVLLGGGILLWHGRPSAKRPGTLMVLTSIAWLAGGVLHRGPLTQLLLTAPSGRIGDRRIALVIAFAYVDGIAETIVPVPWLALVWCLTLGFTGFARAWRSSGMVRRGRMVASTGAIAIASVVALDRVAALFDLAVPDALVLASYDLVVTVVAIALAADLRLGAGSGSAATGIVVELGASSDATSLRDRLAGVLGDPSLVVGYSNETGDFADESGRRIELPAAGTGRTVLPVFDGDNQVAMVVHDEAVLGDPGLVDAVATATRIAVMNLRLRAEIDDRVLALQGSQRRLLAAEANQRSRIERRLAEGALARLARVVALLSDPAVAQSIGAAPVDLRSALDAADTELRSFARGVYPASLTSAGLAAAVEELASSSGHVVDVALPPTRLPPATEVAAYFVCAEALANAVKHARATRIGIEGEVAAGALRLSVTDDGVGGADPSGSGIQGLRDRLAAIGGLLEVSDTRGGGTTVSAIVPITTKSDDAALALSPPA